MLTLFYAPGACSMASHILLEESGEKYELHAVDLAKGEQRTEEYRKINPQGKVPAIKLDDGQTLNENTALLPYLGKRFGLWPKDALGEARALSLIGFCSTSLHPSFAHIARPERFTTDTAGTAGIREAGIKSFHENLQEMDRRIAGREWFGDAYSAIDPYALVFYNWGKRRELPMDELKNYTAFKDRMKQRPAVQRVLEAEKVSL